MPITSTRRIKDPTGSIAKLAKSKSRSRYRRASPDYDLKLTYSQFENSKPNTRRESPRSALKNQKRVQAEKRKLATNRRQKAQNKSKRKRVLKFIYQDQGGSEGKKGMDLGALIDKVNI